MKESSQKCRFGKLVLENWFWKMEEKRNPYENINRSSSSMYLSFIHQRSYRLLFVFHVCACVAATDAAVFIIDHWRNNQFAT